MKNSTTGERLAKLREQKNIKQKERKKLYQRNKIKKSACIFCKRNKGDKKYKDEKGLKYGNEFTY